MRIQHNIMAMNAYRNYTNNVSAMKKNLEKLSSGYKINRAGDDAAGLAISEKMRAQITGLQTAQKNAKDGISLVQTAEGALTEVHDMLNRMVELATQSANGTYDNTTDRYQMQKEVDQLLSEIDRIADSSNFNGIKLLDGTLGLNTDAFKVNGTADGAAAVLPQDITKDALSFASAGDGPLAYHGSESVEQVLPSFEINLGGLELEVGTTATTGNKGKVTLTIGTTTATIDASVVVGDKANWDTAAEVAGKIVAKYGAASAGATATKALKIGDLYFKAEAVGNTGVKFTCIGNASDGAGNVATAATLTDAQISAINGKLKGMAVSVGGSKVTVKNDFADHNIMKAEFAVKESAGKRAGIDVTLTYGTASTNGLQDGYTLSIGTNTFKFAIKAGASGTDANTIYIDTNKIGTTASKIQNEAIRQLAAGVKGDFVLTAKNGANGVLHIEEKAGLRDANKYKTAEDIKKAVTLKDAGTPAVNAGTKLDINAAEIKDGNVLTVGTKQIKFAASDKNATAATLKAKLEADLGNGYTVEVLATNAPASQLEGLATGARRFIIRSATADAAAPTVLGKGLTLQIGDTSDDFNQLNVRVQDMHSASIGIGNLKIDTEEAAQAATDKLKAAINLVSDVRGTLGATQNRLDHTINNLSVMTENIQDAESTIRDVDVAEEMMAYTKNNILIQSAQAMLAQANQVPQGVLQLLG